jgi:hypothetical protein
LLHALASLVTAQTVEDVAVRGRPFIWQE